MGSTAQKPHLFIFWCAVGKPSYLFTVVKRIMILTNNMISFTLNVRLLFTPLFGDYTIIGRFIGFVVRIFEIVFGIFFMGVLVIISILLPLAWWLIPIYIFIEYKFLLLPILIGAYILWAYANKNVPQKRVTEHNKDECIQTFRPKTQVLAKRAKKNINRGVSYLIKQKEVINLLKRAELLDNDFTNKIANTPKFSTDKICDIAYDYALKHKSRYVENEHLFVAIVKSIPKIDILLNTFGSDIEMLEETAEWVVTERERLAKLFLWQPDYEVIFTGGFGKGMTGRVTPFLDSMSEDFTKRAVRGGYKRYTVRENSIKKVADLLGGTHDNIMITGPPGSGKTSLVRGIAYKIMEGTKYKSLNNKRVVSMDLAGVVSGTKTVGDIANRLKGAIWEAKASGDIILFIDEIHNLLASDADGHAEVSAIYSILEPELASGDLQFIGATTIQNYRKYIEPNGAFARLFNLLEIEEATEEETVEILKYDVRELESKRKIFVTYPALEKSISLSKKLIHERVLPDKAIKIIDRTASGVRETTKLLDSKAVALEIAEMTKVPAEYVTEDEADKLLRIEDEMKKMVIGQDHALKQIGSALKRARAGIRDEEKPIASFLFVGTTGVGKTQTAKSLAKSYFGEIKNMVRLDMSEYQQLDSMSRLLGSPDGSTKGILTEAIRVRPFTLLLLDEIEKAHPNVILAFLQVLDDGRLTDSTGFVVNFTNTIIIATSNVGTRSIQEVFDRKGDFDEMREVALRDVRSHFAPEFLNRFSGIIVYNPLSPEVLRKITLMLLDGVKKSAKEKNVKVTFKDELVNELMNRGYNPQWGARPMARAIEDSVETYLAEQLLAKKIKQGDEVELGIEVFND